jgi:hypothetical protein
MAGIIYQTALQELSARWVDATKEKGRMPHKPGFALNAILR